MKNEKMREEGGTRSVASAWNRFGKAESALTVAAGDFYNAPIR